MYKSCRNEYEVDVRCACASSGFRSSVLDYLTSPIYV